MSKAGLIFSGGCVVTALIFLVPALKFPAGSGDGSPGPGYFPVVVCTGILILSVILAFTYLRHKEKYFQTNETERSNLPALLITGGAVVLYTILFMFLPFIPLTIIFMVFLNWVYKRPWVFNLIFSVVFTVATYYIFSRFLRVML